MTWKDRSLNEWKEISLFLGKNKEVLDGKLWAIATALETAKRETRSDLSTLITVFTDSREALATIQRSSSRAGSSYLRSLICQKALELRDNGQLVTLRWILSHVGLVGHDKADQSAKNKAHRGRKPVEEWSSLTHIWKKLTSHGCQNL